jgi:hypothetical protein
MNERIRELSDIAYKNHLAKNPHSSYGRRSDYDREFAELIVRECANIAKHNVRNISTYSDAEFVSDLINQHFGVKE